MKLDILPIGLYQENVYVLHHNKHVLIIDPGSDYKPIVKAVGDDIVDGILLTHGHEDHTYAVDDLVDHYHCPVYLHTNDYVLVDPHNHAVKYGYSQPIYAKVLPLENVTQLGEFKMRVYLTPGHTEGSCCIQIRNFLFTGDTLFAGSCGRTDLFSGDQIKMNQSLAFLKTMPKDLIVYPGHGPASTIKQEVDTNYYMQLI